jgi:prepilin-type N-terminal cleavage/methylation domain-containing protein
MTAQPQPSVGSISRKGFTLLEVVIALAVFGFLIGGLLGFLPWGVQGVGKVREQSVAYGLIDGVQVELERMGFGLVERGTMRWTNPIDPQSLTPWNVLLVARKKGGQVEFEQVIESDEDRMNSSNELNEGSMQRDWQSLSGGPSVPFNQSMEGTPISLLGLESSKALAPYSQRWIPEGERYFLIKCSQYPINHRHQHHPSNGFLALQIDVQWPYKLPDPSQGTDGYRRVEERYRSHFRFPLAITR